MPLGQQILAIPREWYSGSKGNTHFLVKFVYVGHFLCLHFEKGHQERKCRFRALIFIYAVGMKTVLASARCSIVEGNLQIIFAEKPAKSSLRFLMPMQVVRKLVGFDARGDSGAGLDRLLIESSLLLVFSEKTVGADGHKYFCVALVLRSHKPLKRFDPCRYHLSV